MKKITLLLLSLILMSCVAYKSESNLSNLSSLIQSVTSIYNTMKWKEDHRNWASNRDDFIKVQNILQSLYIENVEINKNENFVDNIKKVDSVWNVNMQDFKSKGSLSQGEIIINSKKMENLLIELYHTENAKPLKK